MTLQELRFKERWNDGMEHLKPGKYIIYRGIIGGRVFVTQSDGALLQRRIPFFFVEVFIDDIEQELRKMNFQNYYE